MLHRNSATGKPGRPTCQVGVTSVRCTKPGIFIELNTRKKILCVVMNTASIHYYTQDLMGPIHMGKPALLLGFCIDDAGMAVACAECSYS